MVLLLGVTVSLRIYVAKSRKKSASLVQTLVLAPLKVSQLLPNSVGPTAVTSATKSYRGQWQVASCNSLDGRQPANLQTTLVTWYGSASE
jgi:hypothetical protein